MRGRKLYWSLLHYKMFLLTIDHYFRSTNKKGIHVATYAFTKQEKKLTGLVYTIGSIQQPIFQYE